MATEQVREVYYLFDARLIESSRGVHLDVCPPQKAGPVLTQEKPWESFYLHPQSLIQHNGEYLLYYLVYLVGDGPNRSAFCVATSQDGLHWDRPELGQVAYRGSTANNMLAAGGTVSIDSSAPPERRFLMTGCQAHPVRDGVVLYTSPDGRVWTQTSPILSPFTHDASNQVFFDVAKGKYVAYLRGFPGRRTVVYYEPPEVFKPWPIRPSESNRGSFFEQDRVFYVVDELPLAIDGDEEHQVYNPGVVPIEGMYLAFPDIFHTFPGPEHPDSARFPDAELYAYRNDGLLTPRLYVSEDGVAFRPIGQAPYIDLGFGDDLDTQQVRMATGFIERNATLWQYYGGHQTSHTLARGQRPRRACAVMRVVQRRDGFAAMAAGPQGGQVLTTPLSCSGRHLFVNFDAGAWGQIAVELLDAQGRPIPEYTAVDAAPLVGNAVYGQVLWSDRRDLGLLAGEPIRIRFSLRNARLFSFKFK